MSGAADAEIQLLCVVLERQPGDVEIARQAQPSASAEGGLVVAELSAAVDLEALGVDLTGGQLGHAGQLGRLGELQRLTRLEESAGPVALNTQSAHRGNAGSVADEAELLSGDQGIGVYGEFACTRDLGVAVGRIPHDNRVVEVSGLPRGALASELAAQKRTIRSDLEECVSGGPDSERRRAL